MNMETSHTTHLFHLFIHVQPPFIHFKPPFFYMFPTDSPEIVVVPFVGRGLPGRHLRRHRRAQPARGSGLARRVSVTGLDGAILGHEISKSKTSMKNMEILW